MLSPTHGPGAAAAQLWGGKTNGVGFFRKASTKEHPAPTKPRSAAGQPAGALLSSCSRLRVTLTPRCWGSARLNEKDWIARFGKARVMHAEHPWEEGGPERSTVRTFLHPRHIPAGHVWYYLPVGNQPFRIARGISTWGVGLFCLTLHFNPPSALVSLHRHMAPLLDGNPCHNHKIAQMPFAEKAADNRNGTEQTGGASGGSGSPRHASGSPGPRPG